MCDLSATLSDILKEHGADGYIVLSQSDIRYFSGLVSSNIALLVTEDGSYVFSDPRYKYRIEAQDDFIPVVCGKSIYEELRKIIELKGLKKILLDPADIPYGVYLKYFFDMSGKFILKSGITQAARSVKSRYEIGYIRKAQRIAEKALSDILPVIQEKMTTAEICAKLEYAMKAGGSEEPAFDTIVLSGSGTADCHGIPDKTMVRSGDFILFDFGATVNGYKSDMTRTFAFKGIGAKQAEIYDLVLKAHMKAARAIKSNAPACSVDNAAREVISEAGYGDYFLHSTGHGVGLDIHEFPNVSARSDAILGNGMIITDEPGIYINDMFGVRIEDMYIVKETRGVSLAEFEKKLIILK